VSPPNANAREATGRARKTNCNNDRILKPGCQSVKSPVENFLEQSDFTHFLCAFPYFVGPGLSFSDWLELNNDSLPEPQSFSEWLVTRDDAISPDKNLNSNTT
jgi:hypothetical protein